jgi:hypothetical protein
MGKLHDSLQKQLETEYRKEAEDCIKIYDKLKEISKSYIWHSHWDALTDVITFISNVPVYKPSPIGEVFLKGIDYGDTAI